MALQSVAQASQYFRVTATGVVRELDKAADIVKKLKLVGYPLKVKGEAV